jgi:hypothetical protein
VQAHRVDRQYVHGEVHAHGGARRRVAVAVAAEDSDPSFGEQLQGRRMQSGPRPGGIPRPERPAAGAVTNPDEQEVALLNAVGGDRLRGEQVIDGHVITRLQPRHPAHPRDVEQQAPAGDALTRDIDGQLLSPGRGHRRPRVNSVVKLSVEDHMAQRIDMTVGVAVNVHRQAVGSEGQPGGSGIVGPVRHLVDRRIGIVRRQFAYDRRGQRHGPAVPDVTRRGHQLRRRDVVERAQAVVRPPYGRAPQPLVKRPEVSLAEREIGHCGSVAGRRRAVII